MTYYDILGVKRTASSGEIKNAYKKLIKKYHPDIYNGDKEFAEKKAKEINIAYDTLSDETKRKEYDAEVFPVYTPSSYNYTPPKYDTPPSGENYRRYYEEKYNQERQKEYNYYDYAYRTTKKTTTKNNYYADKVNQTVNKYQEKASNTIVKFIQRNKAIGITLIILMYVTIIYFSFTRARAIFSGIQSDSSLLPGARTSPKQNVTNSTIIDPSINNPLYINGVFNINALYSDAELRALYEKQFKNIFPTFAEFKKNYSAFIESEYSF